ncbi:hypothetical protein ACFXTN_037395 [Malus domestica]
MFAASLLARFMHGPSKKQLRAAKRVLRYIQGTLDYGIEYEKGKESILIGCCDSDWSGDETDIKNTFGCAFSFGSGAFSWASVKQHSVALSTTKVEYMSATEATTQAVWLRFILQDFGEEHTEATPVYCDNISVIAMTRNQYFIKELGRRYHYIREALQSNIINLIYCKLEDQLADIFTKALPKDRLCIL